jgi:hypothetical protein
MNESILTWDPEATPGFLIPVLECLKEEYPLHSRTGGGRKLVFLKADKPGALRVTASGKRITIEYGSPSAAVRGIGHALAGQNADGVTGFQKMGIMLDCSRNAVMKVPHVKKWLRRLALMGYNVFMLYTEDTYQLPGEPYFGYMRGGYSGQEIREIDDYARRLGIEVVACIQTLGHMGQMLKWPHYRNVKDTMQVLLADEERTYALVGKMIAFWSEHLGSRRIHVGMDEAHDLGRGRYMDLHGCQPAFEVFDRHLKRIESICSSHGLRPMIWSDMYFRMGNPSREYYDRDTVIPDSIKAKVPEAVDLVYWDYCSSDEGFYTEWIQRHRELGNDPVMASGIWTWSRFWYDHAKTTASVKPCVDACRKAGLSQIFFTLWGDGNSYCEFDSAFAGIAYAADLCYGRPGSGDSLSPMLKAVCSSDFSAILVGTGLQVPAPHNNEAISATTILWDDPLLGIGWQGFLDACPEFWPQVITKLLDLREKIAPLRDSQCEPDFDYLWRICDTMVRKLEFREALVLAYDQKDLAALRRLKDDQIPVLLRALAGLEEAFRRQWLRRNKPFGMETTQIRLGAGSTRYREAALRIGEYCDGRIGQIEELEMRPGGLGINPVDYFVWLATGGLVM